MAKTSPSLIWCADGNFEHSRAAIAAGWLYGVRLPAKGILPDAHIYFADQDWKNPNRSRYMNLLAKHRPALATVIDWEHPEQYAEVISWAEEAAQFVSEAVLIVAKVPGGVQDLPSILSGREVRIAYSVPTAYGGSPLGLWELQRRPIHLLGGSPQKQMEIRRYLGSDVKSADGNMVKKMATSRCCYWSSRKTKTGHWVALDGFDGNGPTECVRRSCLEIMKAWVETK